MRIDVLVTNGILIIGSVSRQISHHIFTHTYIVLECGIICFHAFLAAIRDLIEDRARSVRLRCKTPHHLAARLMETGRVSGMRFTDEPDILVVETAHADAFFESLSLLGLEEEMGIEEVLPLDDDLQSVFEYLVR